MDDRRGEESVPVRGDYEAKIHEPAHEDLEILEHVDDVSDTDGAFGRRTALVLAQAPLDVRAFFGGEPFCVFGELGDDEEEDDGDDGGEDALEDEDPAPALVAAQVVHFADCGGEEAAEGAGEGGATEEEGVAPLGFAALVPHSDEVE